MTIEYDCLQNAALIVAIILALWVVMYHLYTKPSPKTTESFNGEEVHSELVNVPASNTPVVNPETSSIMNGPGFELGDVSGAQENIPSSIPSNYYFLDDGANGEMSIQHNLCSKSCCSEQWPTPFKQKNDPYVCSNKDDFVPSNIMCNNTFQDSGCLCLSKKQGSFLYNRGGNGREWF
jgi:hypothetical protein